jgi:replicative DNA helicase
VKGDTELPSAVEAEKTILAAILLDNEYFFDDTLDIKANDFSLSSHRTIYLCINDILFGLVEGVRHVDIVTLSNELTRRKEIRNIGGVTYLSSLTEGIPRRPVIDEYVLIVKDKARLRRLMGVFNAGMARAQDQSEAAEKIIGSVQEQLIEIVAEGADHSVEIGSVSPAVEQRIDEKRVASQDRAALELTWGLSGLDDWTKGAFGGELTVVSGEAGGGKSQYAIQMTLENAKEGTPCGWFSLEMPNERVVQRYYPLMGSVITANMMRDPRLINSHTHIPEIKRLSAELSHLPIRIDDESHLHINRLVARIRMMVRRYGTRLFVCDYLQLIGHSCKTEVDGIREIVFRLRDLVKEEPSIHIVLISQYSKSDGFSKNKKRTGADLYGGSAIRHAAHNIFLISIEDPEKKDKNDLLDTEIRINKQREGRTGKVNCYFDRDHLKYTYPQPPLR